jgi:galactokinase
MQAQALLETAQAGGFWSYIAGVAYQVLTNYHVRGLVSDNTKTDLPMKKGLSSSAAISVLAARAFNRVYDRLNRCYPFPDNPIQQGCRSCWGRSTSVSSARPWTR